ncbi:hypothetical protein FQV27_14645 [Paracoccus aurantiacus]|uniref:SinR family protein n=1 Tax=Paracoccus aurantiacus TaxID=2599412 RepID=A0A5C6S0E0_9RHOB|nr:hypothetical protein [Paracoccus aurantiacus]TXB67833.1 hypothetical protein FQV27_14645 [Paracoccus aurantiacus]
MAVYLVTYDLRKPGRNYQPVHQYLKQFNHCKDLESVWLLDTNEPAPAIRDELKSRIDASDTVLVIRLQKNGAWWNYGCSDWINSPSRNW